MYEALYTPLPDCAAYAKRIGVQWPLTPDLKTLDEILFRHQCNIPFENLEAYAQGRTPSLEIPALYEKIVNQGRGGYCFELNALLCAFLQGAGYDACAVSCRILRGKDFIPPMLHRGVMVRIGEQHYYCDVGYGGPQPGGAVPLGGSRTILGETFLCEKREGDWWGIDRINSRGQREKVFEFLTIPMPASYFVPYNFYCANSPDSVFTQKRLLNRRTEEGSLALTEDTLTEHRNGEILNIKAESREDLQKMVEDRFGLKVSPEELFPD